LIALTRSNGRIIGSSRFHGYNEADSEVEIGWTFLARTHWGGRYNGEMKRLMLQHGFQFVDNVVFLVDRRMSALRRRSSGSALFALDYDLTRVVDTRFCTSSRLQVERDPAWHV